MSEAKIERHNASEGEISSVLFNVRIGQKEFRKVKDIFGSTDVLLSQETKLILDNLDRPNRETNIDLIRVKVGDLSTWDNDEIPLNSVIDKAEEMGLKFCNPGMVFYVAGAILENDREGIFYIPTEINNSFRIFSVEKRVGGVDLMLYDNRLVNRGGGSPFGRKEQFLFDK